MPVSSKAEGVGVEQLRPHVGIVAGRIAVAGKIWPKCGVRWRIGITSGAASAAAAISAPDAIGAAGTPRRSVIGRVDLADAANSVVLKPA